MNFVTTVKNESKVFSGVFYTLHKMSEARRANLRLRIAGPSAKIRQLLREMQRLDEKYPPGEKTDRPDEVIEELMKFSDQLEEVNSSQMNPAWLLWGLKTIEGIDINGVPATPQSLLDEGPPALFMEIVDEIKKLAQLNGDEEKNFESPTISGEPTDGAKSDSSAVTASSTVSSEVPTEIAASISQS